MKYFKDNFRGYFQNSFGEIKSIFSNNVGTIFVESARKDFNGIDLNMFYDVGGRRVGFDDQKMYIETIQLSDTGNKWKISEFDLPEPIERVTYVRDFMVLKGKENIYYYGKNTFSENYFPERDVYGEFEKAPSTITFEDKDYKIKDIQISILFQVFLLEGNKVLIKYKDEYYFKEHVKNIYTFHSSLILLTDYNPVEFNIIGDALDPYSGTLKFHSPADPLVFTLRQGSDIKYNKAIRKMSQGDMEILFFPKAFIIKVMMKDEYRYFGYGDFSLVLNAPFTYKVFSKLTDISSSFPSSKNVVLHTASNDLMVIVDYNDGTVHTNF